MPAGLDQIGGALGFVSVIGNAFKLVGSILFGIVVVGIPLGILFWIVYRTFMYRYPVEVYTIRAGTNSVVGKDRIMIKKDKKAGTVKAYLRKRKIRLPDPPEDAYFVSENGKFEFKLYKYGNLDYAWITNREWAMKFADVKLKPIQSAAKQFHVQEHKAIEARNKPKDFMAKYAVLIYIGAIVIGLVIVSWIFTSKIQAMVAQVSGVASQIATKCPCM